MDKFDHFILTRFNLNVAYARPETRLDRAWLHDRFELFDNFCYPSVRGQSKQSFTWFVFFDSGTPEVFRKKVAAYSRWSNFVPTYIKAATEEYDKNMRDAIIARMSDDARFIITTRLDNDDALGTCFVEELHKILADKRDNEPECINFTSGYVLDRSNSKLYSAKTYSNQFISFVESCDQFETVYCIEHNRLQTLAPVREVMTAPLWLQVIHGKNAATPVYGARTPLKGLAGFTIRSAIPPRNDWLSCLIERGQETLKSMARRLRPIARRLKRIVQKAQLLSFLFSPMLVLAS
jgi:hypothetical protein